MNEGWIAHVKKLKKLGSLRKPWCADLDELYPAAWYTIQLLIYRAFLPRL